MRGRLTTPAYYELNGKPTTIPDGGMLPQVLTNGTWAWHYDTPKFRMDAERITKEEFDQMVAEAGGPPYAG